MIRYPLAPNEAAAVEDVLCLVDALHAARGNIRAAAVVLEMSEHTLRHRMKDLRLVDRNRRWHTLAERQPKAE